MTRASAASVLAFVALFAARPTMAAVTSGTYAGNGSAPRAITGLGFRPDVVIIKGDSSSVRAVVRTATMGLSKEMTGAAAATSGYITSLDADGFTVTNNSRVNQAGIDYYWIAFQTTPGESRAGSYTGNGNDTRSITGLGFTPSYVMVIPESVYPAYHRSSPMQESYSFDSTTGQSNHIQTMVADGFQIGDDYDVNRSGYVYHYVAWKAVAGRMAIGSFVGLENDDRAITGAGFRPAYVIVKADDNWSAAHKPVSTGPATDATLLFNLNDNQTDNIQELRADGFEVGRQERVNSSGRYVYWMAWAASDTHLSISRSAGTITVETPAVKMVWDEGKGGGLHEFYAKTEANPGTSRVGSDASYNLFATGLNGLPEAAALGPPELLEATATRARIRQRRDFIPGPSGVHMERDWTVYGAPRLGIRETLTFDVPLGVQGSTGLHAKGQSTCSVTNTFYCAGRSDAAARVWLATDNRATYSDALAIPYVDPFFGRDASPAWDNAFEAGTPNSWLARVRETSPVTASGSDTRSYLLHPHIEGLTSTGTEWQPYVNEYRAPSPLAIAQGSPWTDAAENTGAADAFNEAEAAYVLNIDPVTGLDFSVDGSTTAPRVRPFFKIRQWRSLQEPATVVLQGTALVNDRDFTADVKPVAYAAFCPDAGCTTATRLARGGLVGDPDEHLADPTWNFPLAFSGPGVQYLYLGADSRFRGLNVALQPAGVGSADLAWEYYDGSAWVDLEAVGGFTDLASNLTGDGTIFWGADPAGWSPAAAFAGWPSLYYVRASLAGGSYGTFPVESQIRTDILLFQYLGSLTAAGRRFVLGPASSNTRYRSIGTRPDYGTAGPEGLGTTVTATNGSTVVTGSTGTAWRTANRGRGDRIQIEGVDYTVYAVTSETQLELTEPYAGASGSGWTYAIARKFGSLAAWEDCIDGPNPPCEGVSSPSLVADNRNEVGIVYRDSPMPGGLVVGGSGTDANHTITLTADHGNRHYGLAGTPGTRALVDNAGSSPAIRIEDEHVIVEWLEIRGGSGSGAHGVMLTNLAVANRLTVQNLLVHHNGSASGIEIDSPDAVVDVLNNIVYEAGTGIRVNATPSGTSRIRLLSNTVFSCNQGPGPTGIRSMAAGNVAVILRNNIAHGNNLGDFGVPGLNSASSHNVSGDTTYTTHNPGLGGFQVASAASIFVSDATPDLHLRSGSPVVDVGAELGAIFKGDIDAGIRSGAWDIGADELSSGATDFTITKDDGQGTAIPGGSVAYTITVRNNGPTAVSSLRMVDVVPPILTSPVFSGASRGAYDPSFGTWDFTVPPLPLGLGVGETATIQLIASIDPAASGTLANTATVFPPPGVTDAVPQNDSATDSDVLASSADVAVGHGDAPDPVDLGSLLTYTLTVTNNGPSRATGVVLTDLLPPEMEFDAVTSSQGVCGFDGPRRVLTCDLGDLLPGVATVGLTVRPRGLGTFTATASVVRNEPDPDPANDSAAATTTVQVPNLAVRFLTVTSTSGRNVIEWLNPPDPSGSEYASTRIVSRTDRFPADPLDGTTVCNGGTAGSRDRCVHDGVPPPLTNGQTYYYAAFVHRNVAPLVSPGRFVTGRPFATTPPLPVKWAFSTGGFSVTPPTVGGAGIIATSNDLAVHAMARGPAGGEWPKGATAVDDWHPYQVGGPVQSRPPVVPIPFGGADPVVFIGAQDGYVYALDGLRGGNALPPWPPTLVSGGKVVQAAPAGIFAAFGGAYDYLLVGTRQEGADNVFAAVDPETGNALASFDNGGPGSGIGIISGMAAVDYASPPHVYFTSRGRAGGSASTLWCLQLTGTPTVFTSCPGWTSPALGDIDGSPVIREGRIYVGSATGPGTGSVYSVDATSGSPDRSFVHGDGQVKGFVFPDRNSDDIYLVTDNLVWAFSDTAGGLTENFPPGGLRLGVGVRPSAALVVPGSHYVYVGGSDGRLYEIDVAVAGAPVVKSVPLGDGSSVVGAPSLDRGYLPNLVHVGTEAGVFYAVEVPLP